jgi:HD-GYP domain-containing protein (c-di-GMP phosphodiesterase class II)
MPTDREIPIIEHPDTETTAEGRIGAEPWAILTRLLHRLDVRIKVADQIRETLQALHETTGADLTCWFNQTTSECISATPTQDKGISPEALSSFAQKLIAKHPDNQGAILWHSSNHAAPRTGALPTSAVAVLLSRTQPEWLLGVSFQPDRTFDGADVRLMGLAGAMLLKQTQHTRNYSRIKESLFGLVQCLAGVIDAKDSCTAGHSDRVSRIAVRIGNEMELDRKTISDLRLAGLLHDVGKVGIRDDVLHKPGKLTIEETKHIQEHVVIGDQIVSTIKQFASLRPGIRSHHERFDGNGYPDGLAGKEIPLIARVLAVADSCDAMISARRYRGPVAPPAVDAIFLKYAGQQWDPEVVSHFMACRFDIYPPIYQKAIGESTEFAVSDVVESLKDGSSAFFRLADLVALPKTKGHPKD